MGFHSWDTSDAHDFICNLSLQVLCFDRTVGKADDSGFERR